jgi:serine/threonine-protein kinase HipA
MRRGLVYCKQDLAGAIEELDDGSYQFVYDRNYLENNDARPVSLTLPKQASPFISKIFFPFFDGLIPEGWLLDLSSKNWKINPRDRMGLLLATCEDCIGDIKIINQE